MIYICQNHVLSKLFLLILYTNFITKWGGGGVLRQYDNDGG